MEVKTALTFACLNLKKLAKKRWKERRKQLQNTLILCFWNLFPSKYNRKPAFGLIQKRVCRRSESSIPKRDAASYYFISRYRNVTIWPRVQGLSGENVFAVVPLVMFFDTAQRTALV